MNHQVRKITEGAMMCDLFGMVLLINLQFAEVLEIFFVFVLPLPLIVYTVKYGFKSGLVCAVSISFLSLMISSFTSMIYSIMSILIGLVYGSLARRKASSGILISVTMILAMLLEVACMIVFASLFGYDLIADAAMIEEMFLQTLEGFGIPVSSIPMLSSNFFIMIAIVSILLTGIMEGFLVHLFAGLILKRLKIEVHSFSPLSMWRVPKWVGFVCAGLYIASQLIQYANVSETVQLCVMAVGIMGTLVLVLFGYVACLLFAMVKYKKNITLLLILLFVFIWPFLVVMGFFYITSDEIRQELVRRRD